MDAVGGITPHIAAKNSSDVQIGLPSTLQRNIPVSVGAILASSGRAIGVALPRVQFCLATIFLLTLCFLSGRNEATSAAGVAHALSADYSDVTTVVHKENPVDSQETLEPPKARVTDLNDSAEASEGKVQNLNETPSSSPMEGAPRDVTTVVDSVTNQKKIIGATEANPVDDHNTGSPSANAAQEVSKLASSTSWIFGMILGAAASFAGALGDNIVRLSYVKEQKRECRRSIFKRPLWLLGEVLTVLVNPLLSICALNFAPASLVVPFGGLHIAWNACLVQHFNGEEMSNNDFLSSFIIVCGLIFVVVFGSHELQPHTVDQLVYLAMRPAFTIYCIGISVVIVLSLLGAHFTNSKELCTNNRKIGNMQGRWCSTWKAARIMCSGTPLWAQRLSVTTLSGTFGAGSNLCVKAVLEMLGTEGLWQCLTRLPFYITGVATVVLCALQLLYLNLALFRYQAKYVVTLVNASLIAVGSAGGLLFFEEYKLLPVLHISTYAVGVMLVMGGVWLLASGDEFKGKPANEYSSATGEDTARDSSEDRLHLLAEAQGS